MTKDIISPEIRFWKRVNKNGKKVEWMESNCWEFIHSNRPIKRNRTSMAFSMGNSYPERTMEIGRASWILSGNSIPEGKAVIRRCKNYLCVRPDHLYVGDKFSAFAKEYIGGDGKTYKKCSICKKVFEFTPEFFSRSGGWNKKLSCRCKSCGSIATKANEVKRWPRTLLYRMKDQDKECSMTEQDLLDLYNEQDGKCYWLGLKLEPSVIHRYPAKISPDRLDRNKGYTKDNVVLTSIFANVGRNSCDLKIFISYIEKNLDVFGNGIWRNDNKWKIN